MNRLQYITDSPEMASAACEAGVKWIQARIKNKSVAETKVIATEILSVCKQHGAICILNDFIQLALEIGADGVHLGKQDTAVSEAKEIIGNRNFILGGTANTFEDVKSLAALKVNYIGLGPFRFTTTKEKLSPVLGAAGYQKIIAQLENEEIIAPPIYAIGGIGAEDVKEIISVGIYGVAVSGVISNAKNKNEIVGQFYKFLNEDVHAKQ
jgi:thiamine-phosphate pyrophosphorylase